MRSLALAALAGVTMAYDHWAVLVAGSNTYSNYRHQADVHHAYQILRKNGMPAENIILMSYDDLADNFWNPYKGQLFNKPNGENVYHAEDISYKGRDVSADTFLAVLKGDSDSVSGGPVLKSTSKSKVFVYYADHGAPGFVGMPHNGKLYADKIQEALTYMHTNSMYDELVFYMEACESGSMFPDLADDMNVYAVTAANASQSSYGTYCGNDAVVGGKNMHTCLGDLFSVNWMEDAEVSDPLTETLNTQFSNVKNLTTKSEVCKFGDFDFVSEPVGDFEGDFESMAAEMVRKHHEHQQRSWSDKLIHKVSKYVKKIDRYLDEKHHDGEVKLGDQTSYDARDATMQSAYDRYAFTQDPVDLTAVFNEMSVRGRADYIFKSVFGDNLENFAVERVEDYDCLRMMVNTTEMNCGYFTDYSLKYARTLAWSCNNMTKNQLVDIIFKIGDTCAAGIM